MMHGQKNIKFWRNILTTHHHPPPTPPKNNWPKEAEFVTGKPTTR